jgi:uncharacterized protein YndB with AHSA1/START domain
MIRGLVRLGVIGAATAWAIDRVLRSRAAGRPPPAVHALIVIDAPVERVWAEVADIEGQPRWMTDMKSVRMDPPAGGGVGARGVATVRMLGITVEDPVTVTEFDPPTRYAVRHEGVFTGTGRMVLEPGADGTTTILRWEEALVAPVVPHFAAVVTAPLFRSVFQRDLERLRDLVEGSSASDAKPAA